MPICDCSIGLQAHAINSGVDKSVGNILYGIATKLKKQLSHRGDLLVQYAASKNIASTEQLDGMAAVL